MTLINILHSSPTYSRKRKKYYSVLVADGFLCNACVPFFPAFLNIVTVRINPKFRVCMLMHCFWMHVFTYRALSFLAVVTILILAFSIC